MAYLSPLAVRMVTKGPADDRSSSPNSDSTDENWTLLATAKFSFLPSSRKVLATFITLETSLGAQRHGSCSDGVQTGRRRFCIFNTPSRDETRAAPEGPEEHQPVPPVVGAFGVPFIVHVIVGHQQVFAHQLILVVFRQVGTESKTETGQHQRRVKVQLMEASV